MLSLMCGIIALLPLIASQHEIYTAMPKEWLIGLVSYIVLLECIRILRRQMK